MHFNDISGSLAHLEFSLEFPSNFLPHLPVGEIIRVAHRWAGEDGFARFFWFHVRNTCRLINDIRYWSVYNNIMVKERIDESGIRNAVEIIFGCFFSPHWIIQVIVFIIKSHFRFNGIIRFYACVFTYVIL